MPWTIPPPRRLLHDGVRHSCCVLTVPVAMHTLPLASCDSVILYPKCTMNMMINCCHLFQTDTPMKSQCFQFVFKNVSQPTPLLGLINPGEREEPGGKRGRDGAQADCLFPGQDGLSGMFIDSFEVVIQCSMIEWYFAAQNEEAANCDVM